MLREEKKITINIDPNLATFIKHGFYNNVRWPLLNIGIVLNNTTTNVNEEWLTCIEYMPVRKVFHEYVSKILRKEVQFCVYIKCIEKNERKYITMYDFNYYIIENNKLKHIEKPIELQETLVHTFQDYKFKNTQEIELIAFSSCTEVNEELMAELIFLDIEVFNREYANIKSIIYTTFQYSIPFNVIAPSGKLIFKIETYSWIDTKLHLTEIIDFLKGTLIADIHSYKVNTISNNEEYENESTYNMQSGILYVKDLLTMTIVNFFGCNSRLNTYHRFDMTKIDTDVFISALSNALNKLIELV
ncbi:RNA polymerase subunit RPO35 [Cetacean poxvirus 1]|nr:RNA polymerase subunit RPO35 [Cetacean poxvirus 1]